MLIHDCVCVRYIKKQSSFFYKLTIGVLAQSIIPSA